MIVIVIGGLAIYVPYHLSSLEIAKADADREHLRISKAIERHLDEWSAWFALGMHSPLNEEMDRFKRDYDLLELKFSRDYVSNKSQEDHDTEIRFRLSGGLDDELLIAKIKKPSFYDVIYSQGHVLKVLMVLIFVFVMVSYFSLVFLRRNINEPLLALVYSMQRGNLAGHSDLEIEAKGEIKYFVDQIIATHQRMTELEKTSALGILAAQVSHDLMSPLSSLQVLVDNSSISSDERELLNLTVERINEISRNLLHKKDLTSLHAFPVQELEKTIQMKMLEPTLSKIEIKFDCCIERSAKVTMSASEFGRIVSNIINNSADSYPEKVGSILISLTSENENVILRIQDWGCGMDENKLSKIGTFGTTFKKQGSGIGIHHAFMSIKEVGGEISFKSKLGEGTVVTIKIPGFNFS